MKNLKTCKRYVIHYDTPQGIGKEVDGILYISKDEAFAEVEEFKTIDKILGNFYEYIIKEVYVVN